MSVTISFFDNWGIFFLAVICINFSYCTFWKLINSSFNVNSLED